MLNWKAGWGMALLFAVMGCDGAAPETEELWVGTIDPSEEGGESFDDEVMLGENDDPETLPERRVKETQEGALKEQENPSDSPVNEAESEAPIESSPVITEESAEEPMQEVVLDSEVEESAEEESESSGDVSVSSSSEEGAAPTSGYVLFSVDMGCSDIPVGESVFVLGMDKWNDEWAIAVELKGENVPGHFSGVWEGEAGQYTFLLSYGGYDHDDWSPWFGVESLEGQTCVGDDYDNRAVLVEPGLATNLALTHGYCNGCPGSCSGMCGGQSSAGDCFCDSLCEEYEDCCKDYVQVCEVVSCEGHCGGKPDQGNCYCDSLCTSYNDCCEDYAGVCEE